MTSTVINAPPASPAAKEPSDHAEQGSLIAVDSPLLKDVQVDLQAKLGRVSLSVAELLGLKAGSVLRLEARLSDPVELRLNDQVVATGEVVAVGDNYGIRILDVGKVR